MSSNPKTRLTDAERKKVFLAAAGIDDDKPYARMDAKDTIATVLTAANITPEQIDRSQSVVRQLIRRAASGASTQSPQSLGNKIKPLLDTAAREGRIDRSNATPTQKNKPQNLARSKKTIKPPAGDDERKQVFLDAAGITDKALYEGLDTESTIQAVVTAAKLTYQSIGPTRQAAEALVRNAVVAKSTQSALTLGERVAPLLDRAAQDGRIDRASGAFRKEWEESRRKQPDLKRVFCEIIGVDPARHMDMTLSDIVQLWRKNASVTYAEIGKPRPISYRLSAKSVNLLTREEVEQAARSIAAILQQGIDGGWIDPKSKEPLPIERILQNKLGEYVTVQGHGTEALLDCLAQVRASTRLPSYAISRMLGKASSWLAPMNAMHVVGSDAARIAGIMLPYLDGSKQWSPNEEFIQPDRLPEQSAARDYFIGQVRAYLPEGQRESAEAKMDAVLTPMPPTLGEAVKRVRIAAGLSQHSFGDDVPQSEVHRIEHNAISIPYNVANGQINITGVVLRYLDHIAKAAAENIAYGGHSLAARRKQTSPLKPDPAQGLFARWVNEKIVSSPLHTPQSLAEQWGRIGSHFTDTEITAMRKGTFVPTDAQLKELATGLSLDKSNTILLQRQATEQRKLLEQAGIALPGTPRHR